MQRIRLGGQSIGSKDILCGLGTIKLFVRWSQEALERHQKFFVWDQAGDGGIYTMVEKELALRAHNMGTVQSVL